jgi:hypothetical protein
MTTTEALQIRPDFFVTQEECKGPTMDKYKSSNPRYKNFHQAHFTAGDEEQFQAYRDETNGNVCLTDIDLSSNMFVDKLPFDTWSGYKNIPATTVLDTFRYIFNKFKKGIFVKIKDNQLRVFLPFSKAHYRNEWSHLIKINPKYGSLHNFLRSLTGRKYKYNSQTVNEDISEWYANNCILRYDISPNTKLPNEGDTNIGIMKNMLETLCKERIVPDIEFFMNRRDFPILTKDGTEPYDQIWGPDTPLVSHKYPKYLPILSMCKTSRYADILSPTHEDWARIQSQRNIFFPRSCKDYSVVNPTSWNNKKPTAVFRGASTGCGTTPKTNTRLALALMSQQQPITPGQPPLLDAGITKWNLRPRKLAGSPYLQALTTGPTVPFLSFEEQTTYKYIVNVDGHVSAFRLSVELGSGSVILLVNSPWKIWYRDLLEPYEHFVPVSADLSDLFQQIQWCRDHDVECEKIAKNARVFYETYLERDGVLDFLQKSLVDMKSETGVYLYNIVKPLEVQRQNELSLIRLEYPPTSQTATAINTIPGHVRRNHGLLQGIQWAIYLAQQQNYLDLFRNPEEIFSNYLSRVERMYFAKSPFPVVLKSTENQQKQSEYIHEAFIGLQALNGLLQLIPNFAYTFGLRSLGTQTALMLEYIEGDTLHNYLSGKKFKMDEYLLILLQLCLTLQVAQNTYGFVHYDLAPWNILIQRTATPVMIDYLLGPGQVIQVKTTVIPVIIDYGKSHVIINEKHYGFAHMFKVSTVQDVLTVLLHSVFTILNVQKLQREQLSILFSLMEFVQNTQYCPGSFRNVGKLKQFLRKNKHFSSLLYDSKFELEQKTPMDMFRQVLASVRQNPNIKSYLETRLTQKKTFVPFMQQSNSRQIFEFILSTTIEEQAQSYFRVFERLKHCTIPQPNQLLFNYYAFQRMSYSLTNVGQEMNAFLTETQEHRPVDGTSQNPMTASFYQEALDSSLNYLEQVYRPRLNQEPDQIKVMLEGEIQTLVPTPFAPESFENPKFIAGLELPGVRMTSGLVQLRDMIIQVLYWGGQNQVSLDVQKYYQTQLGQLFELNPLVLLNNVATKPTLVAISSDIYSKMIEWLQKQLPGIGNCVDAQEYFKIYETILDKL